MKLVNKKITIMNRKTIRILMLLLVAMSLGIGEAKSSEPVKNVKYIGWDGTQQKLVEMTTPEGVDVTVLEGTETDLGSAGVDTWYVTKSEMAPYASTITLNGNVHIILANGTKMNVGAAGSQIDGVGIDGKTYSATLSIYGQEQGYNITLGELYVYADDVSLTASSIFIYGGNVSAQTLTLNNALRASNIGIYGGIVRATSDFVDDIYAEDIAIYGGYVTATSTEGGGIKANNSIAIYGGNVIATISSSTAYGICADNKLTLGWTNPTDYILCSSYNNASMETVSGKKFAVYNDNLFMYVIGSASGKTSFSDISSLGNRIYPFEGELVPVGSDKYYAYNLSSGNYKPLNPGVSVYLVTGIAYNQSTKQYEAVLSEAQPGVVSNVPVIFGADKLPNSIALKKEDATVSLSATPSKNFIACDGTKKVSELLPSGVNFADVYFFGLSGNSFKRVLLGSDDVHPAGTCFLFISKDDFNNPPSSAPAGARGIGIETDGTTSLIGNGQLTTDHAASAQWYSLDGRRLNKAPKAKGVYIRNGKKLVIK